jgi:hypothetical protein
MESGTTPGQVESQTGSTHRNNSSRGGGPSIGLSACDGLVDAHCGKLRRAVNLLIFAGLTVLCLSPVLKTGYVSDDLTSSLTPGMLKITGSSLGTILWNLNWGLLLHGRFFPLQNTEIYSVFCLIPNLMHYKIFTISMVVANVLLFFGFVWQISKSARFAGFTAALMLGLFQLRAFYDPILSFAGVQQLIFGTLLISLITLEHYVVTSRKRWLASSVLAYLVILLTYEATYTFFLLHFLLVYRRRPSWKARLVLSMPFAGLAVACVLTTVASRALYLSASSEYQVSTNVPAFFTTFLWQTTAAFPLSYYLADPAWLFTERLVQWRTLSTFFGSAASVLIFTGALAAAYRGLPGRPANAGSPVPLPTRFLVLLGLGLIVLPAVLVSVSIKYQKVIEPGKGYIPVYIESYGVALLLATTIWGIFSRLLARGRGLGWCRIVVACLIAAVTAGTYRANARVAQAIVTPPGFPGHNPATDVVLGCFHYHRLNLEAALRAGLVEDVPDGSIVYLAHEYPWWYERHHAPFFFAMHASKNLRTIPLHDTFFPGEPPTKEAILAAPSPIPPFLVRDVCLSSNSGYVVLSDAADAGPARSPHDKGEAPRELRVFIRHPKLFAYGSTPALSLRGNERGVEEEPGDAPREDTFVRQGRDLAILKSGPDWALLSLRADAGRVDPDSLRALIGPLPPESGDGLPDPTGRGSNLPVTAEWGNEFYPVEVSPEGWWRWCRQRGVLTLRNTSETEQRVKISLLVQGKQDCPVIFDGARLYAEVAAGVVPVRFERELTVAPGAHRVLITTDAPPRAMPQSNDHRTVSFRIINYRVEAKGMHDQPAPAASAHLAGHGK